MRSGRVRSGRVTEVRLERNRRPRGFGRDTHRCDGFDGFSLLLVEVGDVALLGLLHDDLNGGGDRCGVRFDTTSGCASRKINRSLEATSGEYSNSTHRDPIRILGADARSLGLTLVCDGEDVRREFSGCSDRCGRPGRRISGSDGTADLGGPGGRLGRRSPLARLDGPTPGRNPRAEREGSGTRGVRDGREGSMTGGCRVVSVSDPRRAAMFEPRGPRANRGVALLPRQDRGLSRFGGRVGART